MKIRINVWISFKGHRETGLSGEKFPYDALCPSDNVNRRFNDEQDVYDELLKLYDIAKVKGFNLGEALYTQALFFTDLNLLISPKIQQRIKEYLFCKTFNCSPVNSFQDADADAIDDYMIIDEEYKLCERNQNSKINKESRN